MASIIFNKGADASDDLGNNKKLLIDFFHVPTENEVAFKAFLSEYKDQYTSESNPEEVYGRMDPIQTFKGTKRVINLGWDVVAGSLEEAKENMHKCSLLISMLYPTYSEANKGATVISSSPLLKLKFGNLIQDVSNGGNGARAKESGLLGMVSGFSYAPELDQGVFDVGVATMFPQTIKLSCQFSALHQHPLGWSKERPRGKFGKFPYNLSKQGSTPALEAAPEDGIPGNSTTLIDRFGDVSENDDSSFGERKSETLAKTLGGSFKI